MATYANDYSTGIENESIVFDVLKTIKGLKKLKKSKDRYCKYDFYNKKYEIELKTRNNKFDMYPTTLMPVSKIRRDEDNNKTIIFMFKFKEYKDDIKKSIYYIKYDEEDFKDIVITRFKRKSRYGKVDYEEDYFNIPVKRLKCLYDLEGSKFN